MKRFSDKELDAFCRGVGLDNTDWDEGGGFVHEAVVRVILQDRQDTAKEIFEDLVKLRSKYPLYSPERLLASEMLQSLKSRFKKEVKKE